MRIDDSVANQTSKQDKVKSTRNTRTLPQKNRSNKEDSASSLNKQKVQQVKAKALTDTQSIDETKVKRLQKLIDSGKYKVDAAAVADRLVDTHLKTPE